MDGGWGLAKGEASTIQITAMALISLRSCPETPQKATAVNNAVGFLLSGQRADGGFGDRASTAPETALVYDALGGVLDHPDILTRARNYLLRAQSEDGSWNHDIYSTALILNACTAFENTLPAASLACGPDGSIPAGASFKEEKVARSEETQIPVESTESCESALSVQESGDEAHTARISMRDRLQNTKISLVSRRKASTPAVAEMTPGKPRTAKQIVVQSVNTDKKKYLPNEAVYIYSTIDNTSYQALSAVVNAQIANSRGHIIDVASHDTSPTINLSPGVSEPATLMWNTGNNPPGSYTIRFHVADVTNGLILDERKMTLGIDPAIVIDEINVSVDPAAFTEGETAVVGIGLSLQNRSNTEALIEAAITMEDPEGSTVYENLVNLELPVSSPDIKMELASFTYRFDACGLYIVKTKLRSGDTVYSQTEGAIRVSPAIRLEATREISPGVVSLAGDTVVQVGIRLDGVGLSANPSFVRAETNTTGNCISITFDKAMADPSGTESRFSVSADTISIPVREVCLNRPDITTITLYLDDPVLQDQKIRVSCASNEVKCIGDKPLIPFFEEPVVNLVSSPIFNQDGYGYSGMIPPKPLSANIAMTGYTQWPQGFRKGNLAFTGAVFDGEFIWMVPANSSSVIKIDTKTGEMTAYSKWPDGFNKGNLSFAGAVFDGTHIWMIPANADSVVKIDKDSGKMTSYNKWPEGVIKGGHAFSGAVFDGTYIWMIPSYALSVVRITVENGRMEKYDRWPAGFNKGGYAFSGGVFDGRFLWMIPANADSVVRLDVQTGEMTRHNQWPEGHARVEYSFAGGVFDGRFLWMVPYYAEQVIRLDTKTGEMTGHHKRPEYLGKVEYAFSGAVFDGQNIWMVPLNADRIVKIDKDTCEATEYTDWPQGFHKGVNAFSGGVFDGECVWMIPSYADRVLRIASYSSLSVSANITSNDSFFLYISQDDSEEGALVGKGRGWSSIHSINANLVPGATNYLHIKCVDNKGPIAAFIGDFSLNDPNFHFADGSRHIVTSEESWRVYIDRFGGTLGSVVAIGKNGVGAWSTRFGIDLDASWIWTRRGADKGTRYFSVPIYYAAVPVAPMEDVQLTGVIGGPDVIIDESSFTRKPTRLRRDGEKMIAQWDLPQFRIGQREDICFSAAITNKTPGEDRIINQSLDLTYKDATGAIVHREFGPCHVHVLSDTHNVSPVTQDGLQPGDGFSREETVIPGIAGLEATVTAQPNPIYQGLSMTIYYTISKRSIHDLEGFFVEAIIISPDTGEEKNSFNAPIEGRKDRLIIGNFTFSTGRLDAGDYRVDLMIRPEIEAEPFRLATTQFAVRGINIAQP